MSRQARQQSNTGVYHVIQRGVNRMLIFHEDADRRMFLDLLKSQAGEFFKVYCFCLMDNHLTSSLRTPKFFVKEFSYFLMPCHQHGLRINLLVQR